MTASASMACPVCGTALPVLERYMTWCHECGWNLRAPDTASPKTRLDALYSRAGVRLDARLVGRLAQADSLSPRLTASRAGAYLVAAFVHMISLALAATTVLAALYAVHHTWAFVLVAFLGGVAYVLRPQPGKPKSKGLVTREEAPSLCALCDEIAAALGTRPIDALSIDAEFNAEWAVLGWRRRRTLTLGMPLLAVLSPEPRGALIAHELAHARNGDSTRGFFVRGAINALSAWYQLLRPQEDGIAPAGLGPLVNLLMWIVSRPIWWLLLVELHLVFRDSHRAEYLADLLAADVVGAAAVVELHETLLLESTFLGVVRGASRDGTEGFLARARAVVDSVPERERERRRRVARLETVELRSSHPPTASRIALLQSRAHVDAKVHVTGERSASIDAELQPKRRAVERELVDSYRASLYY